MQYLETIENDQGKTDLNKLIVEKLRSEFDNAFSLGESADGAACIRYDITLLIWNESDVSLLDLEW